MADAKEYREMGNALVAISTYLADRAQELRERAVSDPYVAPDHDRTILAVRQRQADESYSRLSRDEKKAADAAERSIRRSYGDS